jgi:hypothetical protein
MGDADGFTGNARAQSSARQSVQYRPHPARRRRVVVEEVAWIPKDGSNAVRL